MGWSIDLVRNKLDDIFANMERKYQVTHPGGSTSTIMIQHEGDIPPPGVVKSIVALFPEFVYVDFVPNSTFPIGSSIVEKH